MTTGKSETRSHIVFCSCAHYDVVPRDTKERVFNALHESAVSVEAVADLCGLAAHGDSRLKDWAQAESLSIVACYPRAIRWLFEVAGAPLRPENIRIFNMRGQSPEEILDAILPGQVPAKSSAAALPGKEEGWVPWFPVIDYDRCKNCKQCMNFCLFGVYGLSAEGQVQVQNPAGCKTNCPACARMCPASAIIFPKYDDAPINGADVTVPPQAQPEQPHDLRSLLKGDVYDKIRQRTPGRKRFSTEPKESPASPPGCKCRMIEALRRDLDIPDDVLASLSPAELQRIRAQSRTRDDRPQAGPDSAGEGQGEKRDG